MRHWNHRIVKSEDGFGVYYELSEVYYDSKGRPWSYGDATIGGENLEDIKQQIEWFQVALTKPVLTHPTDFTGDMS